MLGLETDKGRRTCAAHTREARGYFHVADRQLVSMLLAVYARTTRVLARPETRRDKRARACRLPAERGRGCH